MVQVLQEFLQVKTFYEQWKEVRDAVTTCVKVLGYKEWISPETLEKIPKPKIPGKPRIKMP